MKKQWFSIFLVLIIVCLIGCSNDAEIQPEEYTMQVQLDAVSETALSGNELSIRHCVSNNSPMAVTLREVLIFSVYDADGNPLILDGTSYTPASMELSSGNNWSLQKNISLHQACFVAEYTMIAAGASDAENAAANTSAYTLSLSDDFSGEIVRMDVLLLGKPTEYPYADWELLRSRSQLLSGSTAPAAAGILSGNITLPNFSASQSYHWELDHGNALLADIGSVQETRIHIPATVSLSKTQDGYREDPIYGSNHPVVVAGDAFYGNSTVEEVTFAEGVSVVGNAMYAGLGRGMFQNCTALTAVTNIPDTVQSMKNTFAGCSSLERTPDFPAALEDMTNSFWRCSALTEVAPLPDTVRCMDSSFRECEALQAVPELPEGVENLSCCFYKCTSITEVTSLPDSVTDMTASFCHCTALTSITKFPASLKNINSCFQGCSSLQNVAALPEGVEVLSMSFFNCVSLTEFPSLPDSVVNMSNAFSGCIGIREVSRWPASIENLYGCFSGCTSLTSVPEIPSTVSNLAMVSYNLKEAFLGCTALNSVSIATCSNAISAKNIADHTKVTFTVPHNTSGECDGCHYVTDIFDAGGLSVQVVDATPAFVDLLIPWLETNIPDEMKATCSRITFTPNFPKENTAGISYYPSGAAFIRCDPISDIWYLDPDDPETIQAAAEDQLLWIEGTIYHELAHCYDTNFSTNHRYSNSSKWMSLHEQEGSAYMIPGEVYAAYEFPIETFARATSRYFTDPDNLQATCPGMYDYLDALFGEDS